MCVLLTVTVCLFKGEVKFELGTWGGKIFGKRQCQVDCISNNNVFCVHVQQVMTVTTEEVQTCFVEENPFPKHF